MRLSYRFAFALAGALVLFSAAACSAAEIIPINSFNPTNHFDGGITAGIDFDDASATETDFLGIPASNNKTYNVTTNGITFDIVVTNANLANQNRDRGDAGPDYKGSLVRDLEQWYGDGDLLAAAFTFTGLAKRTDYEISFFTYNAGAGQMTHSFYEGSSTNDPLITTFTTSGNWFNYSTWSPGITFRINSGYGSRIAVTVQSDTSKRITIDGVSLVQGATLPPDGTLFVFQ